MLRWICARFTQPPKRQWSNKGFFIWSSEAHCYLSYTVRKKKIRFTQSSPLLWQSWCSPNMHVLPWTSHPRLQLSRSHMARSGQWAGSGSEVSLRTKVVNSFLLIAFTPKEQPYIWCLPGGAVSRWERLAKMGEGGQRKLDFQSKSVFIGLSQPQFWVLYLLQQSLTYPD